MFSFGTCLSLHAQMTGYDDWFLAAGVLIIQSQANVNLLFCNTAHKMGHA